jgi:cytoskeletal protein RodZ
MKKFAAVVVLIAVGAGLFFVFKSKNSAPENLADEKTAATVGTNVSENNPPASATPKNSESVPANLSAAAAIPSDGGAARTNSSNPAALGISSLPPLTVLDNARVAVKNYGATFGENPVGTNPEITEALTGKNPKGINFITAESGLRVNENGEMVDAYGTPFFFHQLSGQEMEIRSAGEDKKMWTFDDLVTR